MKQRCSIKKRKLLIIITGIVWLFFAYAGHAEEEKAELKPDIKTLSPITVTGKVPDKSWGEQFTTNIIRPDDIVQAGQTMDVSDLLKESQSVFIQNSSYGKKVFLRGLEDQDMRILINGMPAGQMGKYYARSFEWETIPVEAIERIEVTKGAGSVEYGNTIAGTINIITKAGTDKLTTRVKSSYGRFNNRKAAVSNSGKEGNIDWFAGGSWNKRGEYLDNNDLESSNLYINTGIDLDQLGKINLSAFNYHKREGYVIDDRVAWNVWSDARDYLPGSDYTLDNNSAQVTYLSEWLDLGLSYTIQERNSNPKQASWDTGDTQDYDSDFSAPSVKCKIHHSFNAHTLSLGTEYTYGDTEANWQYYNQPKEQIDFKQDLLGFFFEDAFQITDALKITAGLRYDEFENRIDSGGGPVGSFRESIDDSKWSPRICVDYNFMDNMTFYASAGKFFKAPTMADMYRWHGNYNLNSSAGRAVLRSYYGLPGGGAPVNGGSNPANAIPEETQAEWHQLIGKLKPAKGYDYEVGIRDSRSNFAYQINLFYQDIDDYIIIYPVSYPPTYNIDNVELWGIELSGRYVFSRYFEVEGNYTYEETEKHGDKIIEEIYAENDLFNAPKHLFNFTLRAKPFNGLTSEWQINSVGERFAGGAPGVPPQMAAQNSEYEPMPHLGGYTIHNLRISYDTSFIKGIDTRFTLAVENIFNKKTWERLDYPTPGTLFYGGVEFIF